MENPASSPAQDARQRLLQAAERLFAEKGYAGAAVHEITDAAGVNRALLYYYFEDKHDLYAAVLDEAVAEFAAMLDRALATPGTCAERLQAVVREHLELIRRRGDLARVAHRCLLEGYQAEFGLAEKFAAAIARLERFLREGMAAGEFRPLNPEIAARILLGPTLVTMLWRMTEGDRYPPEVMAEEIGTLLGCGLLATERSRNRERRRRVCCVRTGAGGSER